MQYMLFTCAPGFEMMSIHDTVAEAKASIAEHLANDIGFQDWLGILPLEWCALTETVKGGSLETKGEITEAVLRLDLRPSEMLVLAKEIAENCATPQDHLIIQALKDAYEGSTGTEMECPYP